MQVKSLAERRLQIVRRDVARGCGIDPDKAPSDGPNMVKLKDLPMLLETLMEFDRLAKARPVTLGS